MDDFKLNKSRQIITDKNYYSVYNFRRNGLEMKMNDCGVNIHSRIEIDEDKVMVEITIGINGGNK